MESSSLISGLACLFCVALLGALIWALVRNDPKKAWGPTAARWGFRFGVATLDRRAQLAGELQGLTTRITAERRNEASAGRSLYDR